MKAKSKRMPTETELGVEIGKLKVKVLQLADERDEARRAAEAHHDDLVDEGFKAGRASALSDVSDCLDVLERIDRECRAAAHHPLSWGLQVALEEAVLSQRRVLKDMQRAERQRSRFGHG